MAIGGDFKPYRLPCGGVPSCWLGSFYQHAKTIEQVERFDNTTVTHLKTPGVTSGTQTPYERWVETNPAGSSCESDNCNSGAATCSAWIGVEQTYPSVQYTEVVGQPNTAPQTFTDSGAKIDLSECHKRGFKNVAAKRFWQGIWGFVDAIDSSDNPNNPISGWCFGSGVGGGSTTVGFTGWIYSDGAGYGGGNPPQTKYLERTVTINASETSYPVLDGGGGSFGGLGPGTTTTYPTCVITDSINSLSGEGTQSGSFTDFTKFSLVSLIGMMNHDFNGWVEYFADLYFNPSNNPALFTWYQSGSEYGYYYTTVIPGQPTGPSYPWVKVNLSIGSGSFSATRISYQGGHTAGSWIPAVTETVSVSNTSVTYTWENYNVGDIGSNDLDDKFSIEIDISSANTAASVYADACSLLGNWNMADDALMPWRTDGLQQVAPLVSRLEVQGTMPFNLNSNKVDDLRTPTTDSSGNAPFSAGWTPTYSSQIDWFDPAIYSWQFPAGQSQSTAAATALIKMFDGSVQGAPKPAGYQNFFRWDYLDYVGCCFNDGAGTILFDWYQLGWGMWLDDFNSQTGAQLPRNSTQWTNIFQTINKAPGACLIYNDKQNAASPSGGSLCPYTGGALDGNALWAVKYAEALDRWPSQNFARPAGADKFAYDETRVYCVTNISGSGAGSTWTVTDSAGGTPPDSTDFSGTWGGSSVGGFYSVASYSGGTLTLGSKSFNLPSDWASKSGDDGQCLGKLRFATFPSLLGRIGVTVDLMDDPSGLTLAWNNAQTNFGMASPSQQEQVDIYDQQMNSLASNVTATRISDARFTLAAAYPTAFWVMIHGAPAWYMNDSYAKGDFVTMDWTWQYRAFDLLTNCDSSTTHHPIAGNAYQEWTATQHCLPAQPCNPAVACFSPNGEVFGNGITIPFPETFIMDEVFGSRWQGYVMATMTDLFWQTPHQPCGSSLAWEMDDGSCQANTLTESFYPFAPQVECRLTLPGNYGLGQNETPPALPSGVAIGFLSPVTNSGADVAYPPGLIGYDSSGKPIQVMSADVMWARFCAATPSCRFYSVYQYYALNC